MLFLMEQVLGPRVGESQGPGTLAPGCQPRLHRQPRAHLEHFLRKAGAAPSPVSASGAVSFNKNNHHRHQSSLMPFHSRPLPHPQALAAFNFSVPYHFAFPRMSHTCTKAAYSLSGLAAFTQHSVRLAHVAAPVVLASFLLRGSSLCGCTSVLITSPA